MKNAKVKVDLVKLVETDLAVVLCNHDLPYGGGKCGAEMYYSKDLGYWECNDSPEVHDYRPGKYGDTSKVVFE